MRTVPNDIFAAERRRMKSMSRTMSSALVLATLLAMPMKESLAANGAFAGTHDTPSGVSFSQSEMTDTITISTPTAIINWAATDTIGAGGSVDFLPDGTTAIFQGANPFTVLNRVSVSGGGGIALNGAIQSTVNGTQGGNVWFYSAGGILVGGTANFDVGGMLLTTADITSFNQSGGITNIHTGVADPGTTVQINSGASISTSDYFGILAPKIVQNGSVTAKGSVAYVAASQVDLATDGGLFSISIPTGGGTDVSDALTHGGTTTAMVDGSANTGVSHAIYAVAIPKNTAITMLLGGTMGFEVANGAQITNQGIVLSAGRNTDYSSLSSFGSATGTGSVTVGNSGGTTIDAPLYANAGVSLNFSGDTEIRTYGGHVNIYGGADISFGSGVAPANLLIDTSVTGLSTVPAGNIDITAAGGHQINFNGSVTLSANTQANGNGTGAGGDITLFSTGSNSGLNFASTLVAHADGFGGYASEAGNGGMGIGGNILLRAENGAIVSADSGMSLVATGQGGNAVAGDGGDARGGTVRVQADSSGLITVGEGSVVLDASSFAGDSQNGQNNGGESLAVLPGEGSPLTYVEVSAVNSGQIQLGSAGDELFVDLTAYANGFGGIGLTGGEATGGAVRIDTDSAGSITANGQVQVAADATGGDGYGDGGITNGGLAHGGQATIFANGGSIIVEAGNPVMLSAATRGGDAYGGNGGHALAVEGAEGVGARGYVEVGAAGDGDITLGGALDMYAYSQAGGSDTGNAGNAVGGAARISNSGSGTVQVDGSTLAEVGGQIYGTYGEGQDSATGGDATGGRLYVEASNTGTITLGAYTGFAYADGGGRYQSSGDAGIGTGGSLVVAAANDAAVSFSSLYVDATGRGGDHDGGIGANGQGGNIAIGDGSGSLTIGSLTADARGLGGLGATQGGDGIGGTALLGIYHDGGTAQLTSASLLADGVGGNAGYLYFQSGAADATGGEGVGGLAGFEAFGIGTSITVSSAASASASGTGGHGFNGGVGRGGTPPGVNEDPPVLDPFYGAIADTGRGTLSFQGSGLTLNAIGIGGNSQANAEGAVGVAGDGYGGYAEMVSFTTQQTPALGVINASSVHLVTSGFGGNGGNAVGANVGGAGGNGFAGTANLYGLAAYSHLDIGNAYISIDGLGGHGGDGGVDLSGNGLNGGAGGNGRGGRTTFGIVSGPYTSEHLGYANFGNVTAVATGTGGDGGNGGTVSGGGTNNGAGGAGGIGIGGGSFTQTDNGGISVLARGRPVTISGTALLDVRGTGGDGGANGNSGDFASGGQGIGGTLGIVSSYRYDPTANNGAGAPDPTRPGEVDITTLTAYMSGVGGLGGSSQTAAGSTAGNFQIAANGGTLNVTHANLTANGTGAPTAAFLNAVGEVTTVSEVSAGNNSSVTFSDFVATGGQPVNFFLDDGLSSITSTVSCTVNGQDCTNAAVLRNPSPPPPPPPPPEGPPPLVFDSNPPPSGTVDQPYPSGHYVPVSGGTSPYTFTISSGTLPPGLMLNETTGEITGTPTQSGSYPVTVMVTDGEGMMASQGYTFTINPAEVNPSPPPPVSPPPPPPPVSPPPPPPVDPVSPPPPPPPPPPVDPVSPPPPPVDPVSPPPPPVDPVSPPPVIEDPEVVETVTMETTKITSSIQSSLTGTRVAGGSVGGGSAGGAGAGGGGGGGGSSGGSGSGSSGSDSGSGDSGAASTAAGSGGGADDGAGTGADEGGDDDGSNEDSGGTGASGNAVGGANVLIDTSRVGAGTQQIDTPITSGGNSSLWSGADGLGDTGGDGPGGNQ